MPFWSTRRDTMPMTGSPVSSQPSSSNSAARQASLPVEIVERIRRRDVRVVRRVPAAGVDAVADAHQVRAPPGAARRPGPCPPASLDDLGGVGRADRHDLVGHGDGAGQRVDPAATQVGVGVHREAVVPGDVGPALMTEVVDGQHRRLVHRRERRLERGVPVVELDDVDVEALGQHPDRCGERREPAVVVGPADAVGVDVGIGADDAGHVDQHQRADVGVGTPTCRRGRRPVGKVEGDVLDVVEVPALVVGQDQLDLVAERTQCRRQPGGGFAEATGADQRSELGGGEQDPHDVEPVGAPASQIAVDVGDRARRDRTPADRIRPTPRHPEGRRQGVRPRRAAA